MPERYSHIRMAPKRRALEALFLKPAPEAEECASAVAIEEQSLNGAPRKSPHSGRIEADSIACIRLIRGGERGRNRTYNLVIKSHLLCQLSYAPAFETRSPSGSSLRTQAASRTRL